MKPYGAYPLTPTDADGEEPSRIERELGRLHHEPIVLIGIPESKIAPIIDHFRGADVRGMAAGTSQISNPDIVSGATVTVLVISPGLKVTTPESAS